MGASREDFQEFANKHSKESTNGDPDVCYVVDMYLEDVVDEDSGTTRLRVRLLLATGRMLANNSDLVCGDGTYRVVVENLTLTVMGDSDSDRRFSCTCAMITSSETAADYKWMAGVWRNNWAPLVDDPPFVQVGPLALPTSNAAIEFLRGERKRTEGNSVPASAPSDRSSPTLRPTITRMEMAETLRDIQQLKRHGVENDPYTGPTATHHHQAQEGEGSGGPSPRYVLCDAAAAIANGIMAALVTVLVRLMCFAHVYCVSCYYLSLAPFFALFCNSLYKKHYTINSACRNIRGG